MSGDLIKASACKVLQSGFSLLLRVLRMSLILLKSDISLLTFQMLLISGSSTETPASTSAVFSHSLCLCASVSLGLGARAARIYSELPGSQLCPWKWNQSLRKPPHQHAVCMRPSQAPATTSHHPVPPAKLLQ